MATADQLERAALKKATGTPKPSTTQPRIPAGSTPPRLTPARTPAQEAAYQRMIQQQLAENQARMAGTTRQQDILSGTRPLDQGASRASVNTTPRTSGGSSAAPANLAGLASQLMPRAPMGTANNIADLRAMYAKALEELQRQQTQSGETIAESIARMQADPMNTANAFANLQAIAPTVAANPIGEYATAAGISPTMAAEAQRMAEMDAAGYQSAVQNLNQQMAASQQAANQSRMADIGLIETGSRQDLANQANMLNLLLKQQEVSGVSALQQRNLENEMAMRNALTSQISNIFSGQDVAPESILKLIEATMAKLNMSRWQ